MGKARRSSRAARKTPTEQIPNFGHWATKHPGGRSGERKLRTRQNGSSSERHSRSSPERGMGKKRTCTSQGQTEGASTGRATQHQSAYLPMSEMCASRIRIPQNSHLTVYTSRPRETIYHNGSRGTCRNLYQDPKRLKNLETHQKRCMRARLPNTTTRAQHSLGHPHFLAKKLVPRLSAYEMQTDPRRRETVDQSDRP